MRRRTPAENEVRAYFALLDSLRRSKENDEGGNEKTAEDEQNVTKNNDQ